MAAPEVAAEKAFHPEHPNSSQSAAREERAQAGERMKYAFTILGLVGLIAIPVEGAIALIGVLAAGGMAIIGEIIENTNRNPRDTRRVSK